MHPYRTVGDRGDGFACYKASKCSNGMVNSTEAEMSYENCGKYKRTDWHKKISIENLKGGLTYGFLGKHHTEASKEKIRRKKLGKKSTPERNRKFSLATSGERHWNWRGGSSIAPYGIEFTQAKRESIRRRDKYVCQECGKRQDQLLTLTGNPYKLMIHHIDYNKENNNDSNLISLCRPCHMKTNYTRKRWKKYFKEKMCGFSF